MSKQKKVKKTAVDKDKLIELDSFDDADEEPSEPIPDDVKEIEQNEEDIVSDEQQHSLIEETGEDGEYDEDDDDDDTIQSGSKVIICPYCSEEIILIENKCPICGNEIDKNSLMDPDYTQENFYNDPYYMNPYDDDNTPESPDSYHDEDDSLI